MHHSIVKRPVKVNEYSKTETGSVESNFDSVSSVSQQVRTSIAAWVRKQPNEKLRKLKENKHFTICITNLVRSNLVSVRVKCNPCKTYIQLYRKDKSVVGSSYLISNWTRHVKMCSQLNKPSESVQMSMLGFLSAGSFSTSTSQFSSGSLPCTESTSSTTSSNLSDAANESSHDDATNESSHDDLPPTNKEIGTNPQINPTNLDALMTNTGLEFTKTSISSSTPKSKHESDVDVVRFL